MVFTPNSTSFRAAPYLCVFGTCMQEYGSCSLFSSYQLKTVELKKIFLRSVDDSVCDREDLEDGDSVSDDFLLPGTYCAVAPQKSSKESLWFIKVEDSLAAEESITDDYHHTVAGGHEYIEGQFMEKVDDMPNKGILYKLMPKKTFFYNESVVYPFVQFKTMKKGLYLLSMNKYVEILNFVECSGLSRV